MKNTLIVSVAFAFAALFAATAYAGQNLKGEREKASEAKSAICAMCHKADCKDPSCGENDSHPSRAKGDSEVEGAKNNSSSAKGTAEDVQNSTWPLPKFYFSVKFGDEDAVSFQEVTGLESETQIIEYRAGNSKIFAPIKMPGLAKVGNVSLKKGIFVNDKWFRDWVNEINTNTIKRSAVVINLLDETGAPRVTWTLKNAFPTKITGTDLKSEKNEVSVESLEIAYETMTIATDDGDAKREKTP